jgi:hypothetical protein
MDDHLNPIGFFLHDDCGAEVFYPAGNEGRNEPGSPTNTPSGFSDQSAFAGSRFFVRDGSHDQ